MNNERLRVEKAVNIALEHLEYIIDHRTTPDFVEVTGRVGGDVVTYRIYNDGSIYERQKAIIMILKNCYKEKEQK